MKISWESFMETGHIEAYLLLRNKENNTILENDESERRNLNINQSSIYKSERNN